MKKTITKLREAEVLQNQGMNIEEMARKLDIASRTYCVYSKPFGR